MSKEVKRWDELKRLAEAATPGPWTSEVERDSSSFQGYWVSGPQAFLSMENQGAADADFIAAANPAAVLALLAERDAARMRVKELDLLFGRYLLAMKAAVIDADQRGDEEGMRWIYNSLEGPGELPAEDETDAQAFFDHEIKPINDAMAELFAALQGSQP